MNSRRTVSQQRQPGAKCLPALTGIGVGLVIALASVSEAHASTYVVDTSTAASSMTIANDGKCTLAEAVKLLNTPSSNITDCPDQSVGSPEHQLELRQAASKPYATNHFKITSLTITTTKRLTIKGFGAFIDSSFGSNIFSAFVIGVKGGAAPQPYVFFDRVTLSNTVLSNGGRLIENYGKLELYGVTITQGDVSGSRHAAGKGGGIYNAGTISFAENSLLTGNKAKKGGAIFNEAGWIDELAVNITGNSATFAGGGIYNTTSSTSGIPTNGIIITYGATITNNTAAAGGGVFNRGTVELYQSTLSNNKALGGNSDEQCALGQRCDGSGGGALSAHTVNGPQTRFNISLLSDLSNNEATALGGAIYSVGTVDVGGLTVSNNKALNAGFLYYVHSGDTSQSYCNIRGDSGTYGPMSLTGNQATSAQGYSIVAGDDDGVASGPAGSSPVKCNFVGARTAFMTASGNSPTSPANATRCEPGIISSLCPQ